MGGSPQDGVIFIPHLQRLSTDNKEYDEPGAEGLCCAACVVILLGSLIKRLVWVHNEALLRILGCTPIGPYDARGCEGYTWISASIPTATDGPGLGLTLQLLLI
jgi:hypothetical protein